MKLLFATLFVIFSSYAQGNPTLSPTNPIVSGAREKRQFITNASQPLWSMSGLGTIDQSGSYIAPSSIPICSNTPIATITILDQSTSLSTSTNVYGASNKILTIYPGKGTLIPSQQVILTSSALNSSWTLVGSGTLVTNNDGTATYTAPSVNDQGNSLNTLSITVSTSTCGQTASSSLTIAFPPPTVQQIIQQVKYSFPLTSATSYTVNGVTHGIVSKNLSVKCLDSAGKPFSSTYTVNTSTYDVVVSMLAAKSGGYCFIF